MAQESSVLQGPQGAARAAWRRPLGDPGRLGGPAQRSLWGWWAQEGTAGALRCVTLENVNSSFVSLYLSLRRKTTGASRNRWRLGSVLEQRHQGVCGFGASLPPPAVVLSPWNPRFFSPSLPGFLGFLTRLLLCPHLQMPPLSWLPRRIGLVFFASSPQSPWGMGWRGGGKGKNARGGCLSITTYFHDFLPTAKCPIMRRLAKGPVPPAVGLISGTSASDAQVWIRPFGSQGRGCLRL